MTRHALAIAAVALAAIAPAPASAETNLVWFTSPTGNINCLGGSPPSAFVTCMVMDSHWPHQPVPPKDCDLDFYPQEIGLGSSGGVRRTSLGSCRGDVGPACPGHCKKLRYGTYINFGPIRCHSARYSGSAHNGGIACRYRTGKRVGFHIAYEGFTIWHA
jgi:hypothetical protein